MKLSQLKKGLFGYRQADVYDYVAALEEEFAAKLLEREASYKKSEEQYIARIEKLENELKSVKERLEQHRDEQMVIASTLMDATRYAEQLRQEADEVARKERSEWESELDDKQRELDHYSAQILNVREMFTNFLRAMDQQAVEFEEQVDEAKPESPARNIMTLFERKSETGN